MNKTIALVLVTYNRKKLLLEMLLSVLNLHTKPDHVFIVDNNSSDETRDAVMNFIKVNSTILNISYHNTGENLGGAGGFEYGSKLAFNKGFEWVWLGDDDISFAPDCLTQLMQFTSKPCILQPLRKNIDGSCAEISGVDYQINNPLRLNPKKIKVCDIYEQEWETKEIRTIPFEGPLIHRRVFESIGFPNPDFFIFYDDLDFALRAHRAGFKIICVKSARIIRKIKFVQSRALSSWKGYFMYRNFFKVQMDYAIKPIGLLRSLAIFISVSIYSLFTGQIKLLPTLACAFRDALDKDFPLDKRFKP